MKKYLITSISILLIASILTGCWSYVGLGQITIVTGITIDYDDVEKEYIMNFEIIDTLGTSKEQGVKSVIYEVEGDTVFTTIRNAKRRLANKLYFGNCSIIVISQSLAQSKGIQDITDFFMRDHQPREEIYLVISQEKRAKDIFLIKQNDKIISSFINEILEEDAIDTGSTVSVGAYQVYDMLMEGKQSITLPVVRKVTKNDETIVEVGGSAVFHKDKLIGFLDSHESKALLFALDHVKKGTISFDLKGDNHGDVAVEIDKSKTKSKIIQKDGKITFHLDVKIKGALVEIHELKHPVHDNDLKALEEQMNILLAQEIKNVVKLSQVKYKTDYIGIGKTIYKQNLKLWREIEPRWDEAFFDIDIDVKCEITILGTGLID